MILTARWKHACNSASDAAYVAGDAIEFRCVCEAHLFFVLMSQPFAQDHFTRPFRAGKRPCGSGTFLWLQRSWGQANRDEQDSPFHMCLQPFEPSRAFNHCLTPLVEISFPNHSPIANFKTLQDLPQAPLNSRIIFGRLRAGHGQVGSNPPGRKTRFL